MRASPTSWSSAPAPFRADETILRFGEGLRAEDGGEGASARALDPLPGWLLAEAGPESAASRLNPSRAGGAGEGDRERALEGRLAHALLEMLPGLPPERRPGAAEAYLGAQGGATDRISAQGDRRQGRWQRSARRN